MSDTPDHLTNRRFFKCTNVECRRIWSGSCSICYECGSLTKPHIHSPQKKAKGDTTMDPPSRLLLVMYNDSPEYFLPPETTDEQATAHCQRIQANHPFNQPEPEVRLFVRWRLISLKRLDPIDILSSS